MKKWYEHSYINKTNWILENYNNLNLSAEEGVLALIINHANENGQCLSVDSLANRTAFSQEVVDKAIAILCAKKYLVIIAKPQGLVFDLTGLFQSDVAKSEKAVNQDIIELFESEFKRPLTSNEMIQFSEWIKIYDRKLIIYALKESSLYKKTTIQYITSILDEWTKKGYTAQMIENGKHHGF